MLKITPKITELLFDISEIEADDHAHLLDGEYTDLRNNLLKLYRLTDSQSSRDKITAIMVEAGYTWFEKLDFNSPFKIKKSETKPSVQEKKQFMSEDDFLDLLPANGYFH